MQDENRPPIEPVILFDGVCRLCQGSLNFIIRRDPPKRFRFASLQSPYGQKALQRFGLSPSQLSTLILIEGERYFVKSTAALRIAKGLKAPWPLFYIFALIPRFLLDPLYDWVARNRYRWFGKTEACLLPGPDIEDRFLE